MRSWVVVAAFPVVAALAGQERATEGRSEAEVVFHLPFETGFVATVWQGNDQGPSHQDQYNKFAFDFSLPEGTPVAAAADGAVVFVKEDTRGPTGDWHDNNRVVLKHRDGSFSEYCHLRRDGARVKVGEEVVAGDVIADSGDTGMADQPHLHFTRRRTSAEGPSIACRFEEVAGDGVPLLGQTVVSRNVRVRELPAFRVLDAALELHALCEKLDAVEAALPPLAAARKVVMDSPPSAVRERLARRDRLLASRDELASVRRADVERAHDRGDVERAARLVVFAARDFADTLEGSALKRLASQIERERGYADAVAPLESALKVRKLLSEAVAHEVKLAARTGKAATEARAEARRAYAKALEAASDEQRAALEEHLRRLEERAPAPAGKR